MGCDIHFHVERRLPAHDRSELAWADGEVRTRLMKIRDELEAGRSDRARTLLEEEVARCSWRCVSTPDAPAGLGYDARNYSLFSALADVRNSPAGLDEHIPPISLPRGLPGDVSTAVAHLSREWGADGHSHSWATLTELDAYPWDREVAVWNGTDFQRSTLRTLCGLFLDGTLPRLRELAAGDPDSVRAVFWFDN